MTDGSGNRGAGGGKLPGHGGGDIRLPPRPGTLRRVTNGLRLDGRRQLYKSWPAQRWLGAIESVIDPEELEQGRRYARLGQVASLSIESGLIEASVQGAAAHRYRVQLHVPGLDAAAWEQAIELMAGEARVAAALALGEAPPELATHLGRWTGWVAGLEQRSIQCHCNCRREDPCRHAAAAALLVTERLDDEPTLLLAMVGMTVGAVQQALREARATRTGGETADSRWWTIPLGASEHRPLEDDIEAFWGHARALAAARSQPTVEHPPHAILRRLGPSPLGGRFPMVGLLSTIYDQISASALAMRERFEFTTDEGRDLTSDVDGSDCAGGPD